MKRFTKWIAPALSGVLIVCAALLCLGCDGGDAPSADPVPPADPTPAPEPEPAPAPSPLVGTWKLVLATDAQGNTYPLTQGSYDATYLVVEDESTAIFHYMDDDPFPGTLVRRDDQDGNYAIDGYTCSVYWLKGNGIFWELVFVEGKGVSFWYIDLTMFHEKDRLFLTKNGESIDLPLVAPADPIQGTWRLSSSASASGAPSEASEAQKEAFKLVVEGNEATLYYPGDEPYHGKLQRWTDTDAPASTASYDAHGYRLHGDDGQSLWSLVFAIPKDGSDPFWVIETDRGNLSGTFYLTK